MRIIDKLLVGEVDKNSAWDTVSIVSFPFIPYIRSTWTGYRPAHEEIMLSNSGESKKVYVELNHYNIYIGNFGRNLQFESRKELRLERTVTLNEVTNILEEKYDVIKYTYCCPCCGYTNCQEFAEKLFDDISMLDRSKNV